MTGSKASVNAKMSGTAKDKPKPSTDCKLADVVVSGPLDGSMTPSKHKKGVETENINMNAGDDLTPKKSDRPKKEKVVDPEKTIKVNSRHFALSLVENI